MGIRIYQSPELNSPVLVASWPGIGNIGIIAVDLLRNALKAEELGEIEPWDYFYPSRAKIEKGVLQDLEFPTSKFYFRRTGGTDILIFIGEEQPAEGGRTYAEGPAAYAMAGEVIEVAERFGVRRIYTSGAAVAPIHHSMKSRVWAVPNSERLIDEVKKYPGTLLMSDIEGRGGQGNITGLNGLLLGVARKHGIDAICAMGEIPAYLQGLPIAYPKASLAVFDVLAAAIGIRVTAEGADNMVSRSDEAIDKLYQTFPAEIREQLDKLKYVSYARPEPITEEDKKRILEDLDKFFKRKPKEESH